MVITYIIDIKNKRIQLIDYISTFNVYAYNLFLQYAMLLKNILWIMLIFYTFQLAV